MMESNTLLAAALELATVDRVPVFPCRPDKKPYTRNGFKDASCDEAKIRTWWTQYPDALIGVPTGGTSTIAVLDLDLRVDKETGQVIVDGAAALRALMEAHGFDDLPETWTVQTPSGGVHHYFLHEEGFRCSAGQISSGIDTRAEGGYVIVNPSPGYKLLRRKTPVAAPPWLAELFRSPRALSAPSTPQLLPIPQQDTAVKSLRLDRAAYVTTALIREAEHVAGTQEGSRNSTLNSAAFKMGQYISSGHLDETEVEETLLEAASRCGLGEAEARKTIASGMNAGMAQPKEPPPEMAQHSSATTDSTAGVLRESASAEQNTLHAGNGTVAVPPARGEKSLPARTSASKRYTGTFMPAEQLFDPWTSFYAPDFPLNVLPTVMREFVTSYSLDAGASEAAVAMSCMAVLSGAISHGTRLKLSSSFDVGPRLWVLIVGRSSAKKTPAMNGAVKALRELQDAMRKAHRKKLADLKKSGASPEVIGEAESDAPPFVVVNNATVERLQDLLSRQDRGVLMHTDELAGLLGSMDRYSKPSASGGGDKAFWLEAYNGGSFDALRLTTDDREVHRLSISILGGIQPKRMNTLMNLADDGFLQRFLPVTIAQKPAREARDVSGPAAGWAAQIVGVYKTTENGGLVMLSPEAEAEFRAFEREIEYLTSSEAMDSVLEEFIGKLTGVWGSVCLILHLLHGGGVACDALVVDDNSTVGESIAKLATRLMREFVMPHGQLFYYNIGGETRQHLQAIATHLVGALAEGKSVVTARDLQRGPSCFKGKQAKEVPSKIMPFVVGGWLEPTDEADWCRAWHINPAIRIFTERAARHRELAAEMLSRLTPASRMGWGATMDGGGEPHA